jgi:hypothetical protein
MPISQLLFAGSANERTWDYLVVAGGGGGAALQAGGGGAGGLLSGIQSSFDQTFTITVGSGGTGSPASGSWTTRNGSASSIVGASVNISAIGGGAGGSYGAAGSSGGSGGGGGPLDGSPYFAPGGTGTAGQGNNGGYGYTGAVPYPGGGGGGGATSAGLTAMGRPIIVTGPLQP